MKALLALFGCILLTSCSSSTRSDASGNPKTGKIVPKEAAAGSDEHPFKLGINVMTINSWDGARPFQNLIYGSTWIMQNTTPWGVYNDVPADLLDANGWVQSVPTGYRVLRGLSVPLAGGDFVCRYQGHGTLNVTGQAVSNVSNSLSETRFTLAATYPNPQPALLSYTLDPSDYIRNIDCRESSAGVTGSLAPEFTSALAGFQVVRFMKWQIATEGNGRVTWATRNKPGDGDYLRNDGVPIETIVETANQAAADPWVTIPWNADADYITRFATYVRDNLASGRHVYVELSNEVWNRSYPVAAQACNEAVAENLPGVNGGVGCNGERYAEKTKQVMQIWSNVFAGQTGRLVRIAAFQHVVPSSSAALLQYESLYQSVDALATAPYFGYDLTDSMTVDQIMTALPQKVNDSLDFGEQQKAIAQKFGLRYLTYEAGQGIVLPNNVPLLQDVERDARMFDVYTQFLAAWQNQIGDNLNLFSLAGTIGKYGGWGLSEYLGQPTSQAPKLRAVRNFLGLSKSQTGPPVIYSPTLACVNQTISAACASH